MAKFTILSRQSFGFHPQSENLLHRRRRGRGRGTFHPRAWKPCMVDEKEIAYLDYTGSGNETAGVPARQM
jgi:hypothetical protein